MYPQTLTIGLLTAADRMTLSIYRLMWCATIWTLLTRSTLRQSSFMILPTMLSSFLSLSRMSMPNQCPPRPPKVPGTRSGSPKPDLRTIRRGTIGADLDQIPRLHNLLYYLLDNLHSTAMILLT